MLWQLEHDEFPADSYLFGTMHVQDVRAFRRLKTAKEKILECDRFAVEFHLEDMTAGADLRKMNLPEGQKLSDLMSAKKYEKLRKILLKSVGLDLNFFQQSLPFMLLGMVSGLMLKKEMPASLDETLWSFAKAEGKSMHGIETLKEQLEVLDQIPIPSQVKMLQAMGKNISKFRKYLLHVTHLYEQEELQLLSKVVKRNAGGLRKLMLYRRNEVMADRIFDMAMQAPTFAAVGAGHLGGKMGVIRLLKQKGLKVKPA